MASYQLLPNAPGPVSAMCEHKGRLFLAAGSLVYELVDGIWCPMMFAFVKPPEQEFKR